MGWFRDRARAAFGLSFVLAVTAACGGGSPEAKTPASEGGDAASGPATVGQPAPDLSIQTINGKGKFTTASLKGKVAIVDFWATWCGPCKQSFPKFEELSKKYDGQVDILAISVDDEQAGVADWAKENGATFPIAWDEGHAIANRWDVQSMPTTYILDRAGKVRFIHAGFRDGEPEEIAKELVALLDESPKSGSSKTEVAAAVPPPPPSTDDEEADEGAEEAAPPPTTKKTGKGKRKGGKKAAKPKKKKH
jgi:cytochrome c biogenesis protein CcmG, thiol:disulfide interchange protein DsbE